jgi:hypothetical protein
MASRSSSTRDCESRNTPVAPSGSTDTVQKPDEQLTSTCSVAAFNSSGGGTSTTSKGVPVPVPFVRGCPAATGRLGGETLGRVRLGATRKQTHRAYTHSSSRGKGYETFFCLTPIGVRVGYASPALLNTLSVHLDRRVAGHVIWASTSSRDYSVHGHPSRRDRHRRRPTAHVDRTVSHWLELLVSCADGSSTAVLKVQHGIVEETGIGDKQLAKGRTVQLDFLKSFS